VSSASPPHILVLSPGLLTTVQDLGRVGFQQWGVSVSGAMDRYALVCANRLVENPDRAACLEMTVTGPSVRFTRDSIFAVTGAEGPVTLDGTEVPSWTAVRAAAGSRLDIGRFTTGVRAYLSVAGGIAVPVIHGSRSTHLPSGTGGLAGRALCKSDELRCGDPPAHARCHLGRILPLQVRPHYETNPTLRVVEGPQVKRFPGEAIHELTSHTYRVMPQSDRMGYRLEGEPLPGGHDGGELISDATPAGSLQVFPSGQLALLMADCQTTGGYPKIAVVISADLPLAAQVRPGGSLRFDLVDLAAARQARREQWPRLDSVLPPYA
jgi:antagonist of KipI